MSISRLAATLDIQPIGDDSGNTQTLELAHADIDSDLCYALFSGYGGGFQFNFFINDVIRNLFKYYYQHQGQLHDEFTQDVVQLLRFMVFGTMSINNYASYLARVNVTRTDVDSRSEFVYIPAGPAPQV